MLDVRTWWLDCPGTTLVGQIGVARALRDVPKHKEIQLPLEAPSWLSAGDTSWQITAATLVGLMSVPGLAVLYGGVMQKRWSINSMMLTFATFATVLIVWVLWGFKMGFGSPFQGLSHHGFFGNFIGKPGPVLSHTELQHQATIPLVGSMAFPKSALVYFQLVFAAITPILALGSVLSSAPLRQIEFFDPDETIGASSGGRPGAG